MGQFNAELVARCIKQLLAKVVPKMLEDFLPLKTHSSLSQLLTQQHMQHDQQQQQLQVGAGRLVQQQQQQQLQRKQQARQMQKQQHKTPGQAAAAAATAKAKGHATAALTGLKRPAPAAAAAAMGDAAPDSSGPPAKIRKQQHGQQQQQQQRPAGGAKGQRSSIGGSAAAEVTVPKGLGAGGLKVEAAYHSRAIAAAEGAVTGALGRGHAPTTALLDLADPQQMKRWWVSLASACKEAGVPDADVKQLLSGLVQEQLQQLVQQLTEWDVNSNTSEQGGVSGLC